MTSEAITGIYNKTLTRYYAATGVKGRYTGMNIGTEYTKSLIYDTYGRLQSISSGSDTFTYSYLPNSNMVQTVTRPHNLSTTFSYEPHRNLITAVENKHNSTIISKYDYVNDDIGRRTCMSRSGTAFTTAYTINGYNDCSEVTSAVSSILSEYDYSYNFDNIGNRLTSALGASSTSYTANSLNPVYHNHSATGNSFQPDLQR
ncbi:MAG: hypothetical protein GY750_01740 [Lentisphaerae bacterium]|nr:hypothetical protein [Lentisphaerota bacterium]MCP4100143.1 hypothetical protein [Lentisphaerota bacterium]